MANKPVYTNYILLAYIDSSNVYEDKIYIPYACKSDSTSIGARYGTSVCGKKIPGIKGARFYVFGGRDDTGTFKNDLISFDVTYQGGGPKYIDSTNIIPDGTDIPPARVFASIKIVSDGILIYGGQGSNGNALSDLWKYSFDTNQQQQLSMTGTQPSPRILCG